uniref:Uncharacterized protein n=1 Tax=Megaviridae environmental sample TaxID=1737588 RepID=A0A5J6VMG4_9VIRU|nr:MAG: hypothetical protein [Megaviridae environmental sample]
MIDITQFMMISILCVIAIIVYNAAMLPDSYGEKENYDHEPIEYSENGNYNDVTEKFDSVPAEVKSEGKWNQIRGPNQDEPTAVEVLDQDILDQSAEERQVIEQSVDRPGELPDFSTIDNNNMNVPPQEPPSKQSMFDKSAAVKTNITGWDGKIIDYSDPESSLVVDDDGNPVLDSAGNKQYITPDTRMIDTSVYAKDEDGNIIKDEDGNKKFNPNFGKPLDVNVENPFNVEARDFSREYHEYKNSYLDNEILTLPGTDALAATENRFYAIDTLSTVNRNSSTDLRGEVPVEHDESFFAPFYQSPLKNHLEPRIPSGRLN